jgi:NitT/TauT family transport system permease protein
MATPADRLSRQPAARRSLAPRAGSSLDLAANAGTIVTATARARGRGQATARAADSRAAATRSGALLRARLLVARTLTFVVLFAAWELLAGGFGVFEPAVNPALLPPPSAALADIVVYAKSGLLAGDLVATLGSAATGLLAGLIGGFLMGMLLGGWRTVADVVEPLFVGLNSLPRVALAPLLVLWFGLGSTSKIVVALFAVFFIVFFNTYSGARSIDRELINTVRVMGASRVQVLRIVVVPAVLQWVFAALRTSVSFALTAVVVGEFVGATAGLGYRMAIASGVLNTPRVFSILLLLGLVGATLVEIAKRVEQRLLRWRPNSDYA